MLWSDLELLAYLLAGCIAAIIGAHCYTLYQIKMQRNAKPKKRFEANGSAQNTSFTANAIFQIPPTMFGFGIPVSFVKFVDDSRAFSICGNEFIGLRVEWAPPLPLASWLTFGAVGNGDYTGFFWSESAITKEPLIMLSSHDTWSFVPVSSSFKAHLKWFYITDAWKNQNDASRFEAHNDDRDAVIQVTGVFDIPSSPSNDIRYRWRISSEIDPESPLFLTAVADLELEAGNLESAETLYLKALKRFPEYTASRYALAVSYRRRRQREEANNEFLKMLSSPISLSGISSWSNFVLPLERNNIHQYALDELKKHHYQMHVLPEFEPVVDSLKHLSFKYHPSQPPDWRPLKNLSYKLAEKGYYHAAIAWLMNASHLCIGIDKSFDRKQNMKQIADLYGALGDINRETYFRAAHEIAP